MKSMRTLLVFMTAALTFTAMQAQPQDRGARNFPPGETVAGKVTSVGTNSLVIAPLAGGDPVTVNVSNDTRIMKERQPAKLADIKTHDVVFVRGQLSGGAMTAAMVGVLNPEMAQRMQQGGGFGPGRGAGGGGVFIGGATGSSFNREDLGKKFIVGQVKAVNETKLTIGRPDGENQDIEVDENTSFKRGNESITLPDIKVGDFVRGSGEIKNSVFVPKELIVGRPPRMRMGEAEDGNSAQPNQPGNPAADKPAAPAPPKN